MIKWVADIGSNHNRNMGRIEPFIKTAKAIGCWGVKFQLFDAKKLYAPKFKKKIETTKKRELPREFIPKIQYLCELHDIKFICTPFDLDAVEFLKDKVDYFKIGSYEFLYTDLIKAVVETRKPWIISTGMIASESFKTIVSKTFCDYSYSDYPYAILHCNSNYPSLPTNCDLQRIEDYKNNATKPEIIGWSDHTAEPGVIHKAIALGATMIEFHLDLDDCRGAESIHGHCWTPEKIGRVIRDVRIGEMAESSNDTGEKEVSKWRTDPLDGMRPLRQYRKELLEKDTGEKEVSKWRTDPLERFVFDRHLVR